jgi:hypothetical protein
MAEIIPFPRQHVITKPVRPDWLRYAKQIAEGMKDREKRNIPSPWEDALKRPGEPAQPRKLVLSYNAGSGHLTGL